MNILLISHFFLPHVGGIETASYNTKKNLEKLGNKVIVLTSKVKNNMSTCKERKNSNEYRFKSFYPPKITGLNQFSNFGVMPKAIFKLPKIIKKHNIHLIHAEGRFFPISFITAFLNKLIFKKPMVLTVQGRLKGSIIEILEGFFDKTITRLIYQKLDKIICVNNSLKNYLMNKKIRKDKLVVIPNGVDTDLFTKIKYSNVLDNYIDESQKNYKKILFVGRLDRQKGVEYLIRAIPKVVKEYEKSHFFILGGGLLVKDLKKLAKKLEILTHITFLDTVSFEKIPLYYSSADIFCLPSLHEGFPLCIVEALSIGLVIVATSIDGIKETVEENKNGFLVKPKNIISLSEKLLKALHLHQQEIRIISKNNIALAKKKFSWGILIKQIETVYKNL